VTDERTKNAGPSVADGPVEARIPLQEEEVRVLKRAVEKGRVRVDVVPETETRRIEETLSAEHAEIERVPIGREVEAAPPVRREGDVLVIPVVEEVLVVERRLVLKEEVRIRTVRTERRHVEDVPVRVERVEVNRLPAAGDQEPEGGL
jgi:stress response protein YsnF